MGLGVLRGGDYNSQGERRRRQKPKSHTVKVEIGREADTRDVRDRAALGNACGLSAVGINV